MDDFLDWVEIKYGVIIWLFCVMVLILSGIGILAIVLVATRGGILWFFPLLPLYLYVRYRRWLPDHLNSGKDWVPVALKEAFK